MNQLAISKEVLQGSVLSPSILNIYINDIIDELCLLNSNRYTFAYADDIIVISENIIKLKENIHLIEKLCLENGLKLNKNKCGIIKIISNLR